MVNSTMLEVVSNTPLPLCSRSSPAVAAAWSSPGSSPSRHNLDISLITRPPSEAFSTISLATSTNKETGEIQTHIKKISRPNKPHRKHSKRISWQNAGLKLAKSHDSALADKVDSDIHKLRQCFLFSSEPRVVDTAGPISPAHRTGETDSEEEEESLVIPPDWNDHPVTHYLQGVPVLPFTMIPVHTVRNNLVLTEEYDFTLEKKVLGLS